ncbi:MAG: hypothetical protein OJF47_001735 [Nitrospira sp.]|jgi:hypothetical protein|nr:MAG: hypothetical protein OJF47_001735 [Nitrospira sp.]
MTTPTVKISEEEIDNLLASQALKELFQQERQSRDDRVSIWLVGVGMFIAFLILVLFMIQIEFSRPNNTTPTESAWYRHSLPPVDILSRERGLPFMTRPLHLILPDSVGHSGRRENARKGIGADDRDRRPSSAELRKSGRLSTGFIF